LNRRLVIAALAIAAWVLAPVVRAGPALAERDRIEALLQAVARHGDLQFVREGQSHTAAQASRFLRAKFESQGAAVNSAGAFIQQIGSRSSSIGRPYLVVWSGGRQMPRRATARRDDRRRLARVAQCKPQGSTTGVANSRPTTARAYR
jgi:hypothetical protein